MSSRLLVIVSEPISEWIEKGEVIDRYYNPGDLFDEVHILLTNEDRPDLASVQRLVGRARYKVHNAPLRSRVVTRLGYWPLLLRPWAREVVAIAEAMRPDLIRCYGANINAFAASEIRRRLRVPYAVSLHINPDQDARNVPSGWRERLRLRSLRRLERHALRRADVVLPVYQPIVPFLERLGVTRYRVAYNTLNAAHLMRKDDYGLHNPVRVISVGRQFEAKNPKQLIRAVASMPGVHLTLVGDGPLHDGLRAVARSSGAEDRAVFHRVIPNDELCRLLAEQDIFATHSEYWELSKSVLEAQLTGLPVVLNRRSGAAVPELTAEIVSFVHDTPEEWARALRELIADDVKRERLGRAASDHAWRHWSPDETERVFVETYVELLKAAAVDPH